MPGVSFFPLKSLDFYNFGWFIPDTITLKLLYTFWTWLANPYFFGSSSPAQNWEHKYLAIISSENNVLFFMFKKIQNLNTCIYNT